MDERVVLGGFATLDYVAFTAAPQIGAGTTMVQIASPPAWPRAGGAALYAGTRLAAAGLVTHPLLSVGDDPHGKLFLSACRQAGMQTEGIAVTPGTTTPVCVLVHAPNGASQCLLDVGTAAHALTREQLDLAALADMVVLAASYPQATRALFSALLPHQKLAWIVKGDGASFPPDLCRLMTARADYIFCNQSERRFVGAPRPAATVIETFGADGLMVTRNGEHREYPVAPRNVADTTGAGDTLAGEMLAHLSRDAEFDAAVAAGIAAVRLLLSGRV